MTFGIVTIRSEVDRECIGIRIPSRKGYYLSSLKFVSTRKSSTFQCEFIYGEWRDILIFFNTKSQLYGVPEHYTDESYGVNFFIKE